MAIIGIQIDRTNPTDYSKSTFTFWMPQFKNFMNSAEGSTYFNKIFEIVNGKIFKSIYGTDWELAMSYGIAHYLTLIAQQETSPSGDSLASIAGGGNIKGVMSSMQVGSFNKSYDLDKTMVTSEETLFWNQTSYGSSLMALLKTKAVPSMFVVTNYPVPGGN